MRIFVGFDPRQPVAAQVLIHSLYTRSSSPLSITPLVLSQLPIRRRGLTEFTFSRYLVPYLCNYEGEALFMDADMLCLGDITELPKRLELVDGLPANGFVAGVHVVKHSRRFEWPSLMYFNNAKCENLTPALIESGTPQDLKWADSIGALPPEWNHLVGYDAPNPNAKIVHFTQGIPAFKETWDCEFAQEWRDELDRCRSTVSWEDIMGQSVHKKAMGL